MLEDSIKDVIEAGFEVTKRDGSWIGKDGKFYITYIEGQNTFGSHYLTIEEAIEEFLKPND